MCPLGNGHGLPVVSKSAVIPSIIPLLLWRSPSAIIRGVITLIVNAIYGVMIRRPPPHIFVKIVKRCTPAITHLYPSAAIAIIAIVLWVVASVKYSPPSAVFRAIAHAVTSIGFACIAGALALITPATGTNTALQVARFDNKDGSASTPAYPVMAGVQSDVPLLGMAIANYGQAAVIIAYDALNSWGNGVRLVFSHFATSFSVLVRETVGVRALPVSCFVSPNYIRTGELYQAVAIAPGERQSLTRERLPCAY